MSDLVSKESDEEQQISYSDRFKADGVNHFAADHEISKSMLAVFGKAVLVKSVKANIYSLEASLDSNTKTPGALSPLVQTSKLTFSLGNKSIECKNRLSFMSRA